MKSLFFSLIFFGYIFSVISNAGDIKGKVKANNPKNIVNTIIYIDKIDGKTFKPPKKHVEMIQKKLKFIPHVLPVLSGTTVDFLNEDDVLHNVFSPDNCKEEFNLGSWSKGKIRSRVFEEPGCNSVILCNVHPEMEAYILAVGTPYFATSDKEGNFIIKNVPPGKYTLKIWQERLEAEDQIVNVPKKGSVSVSFKLKR